MARQRFIHPDIWSDPTLGQLKPVERLFFIGCFSNADDEGRLLGNPAYLRSTIFPYDDLTIEQVKEMRDTVVLICKNLMLYQVDNVEYLAFIKWSEYQKPKYPKKSKLPHPSLGKIGETFTQNSGNDGENIEKDLPPRLGLNRDGMGLDRDGLVDDAGQQKPKESFAIVLEQELGRLPSPNELDKLNSFIDDGIEEPVVCEAIRRTRLQGIVNVKYIVSILNSWLNAGVKDMAGVSRADLEFEQLKLKGGRDNVGTGKARGHPDPGDSEFLESLVIRDDVR